MNAEHPLEFTVALDEQEQGVLLRVLEESLTDTRVEKRRTEGSGYREQTRVRESIIQGVADKVRRLRS